MSNTDAKLGFKAVRHLGGGLVRTNAYSIASGYATAIYYGDPVEMTGTGRNIQLAAATNADNIGVFAGVHYKDATGKSVYSKYWPASTTATDVEALVYDDPNTVFEIQGDSVAEGDVGALVDWNAGTGSATTGYSGAYAVVTGATGTADKALRILGLVPRPENAYGAYAKIEVMFAEHSLRGVVAGVGGN